MHFFTSLTRQGKMCLILCIGDGCSIIGLLELDIYAVFLLSALGNFYLLGLAGVVCISIFASAASWLVLKLREPNCDGVSYFCIWKLAFSDLPTRLMCSSLPWLLSFFIGIWVEDSDTVLLYFLLLCCFSFPGKGSQLLTLPAPPRLSVSALAFFLLKI